MISAQFCYPHVINQQSITTKLDKLIGSLLQYWLTMVTVMFWIKKMGNGKSATQHDVDNEWRIFEKSDHLFR